MASLGDDPNPLVSGFHSEHAIPSQTSYEQTGNTIARTNNFDISGATRANTASVTALQQSTKTGQNYLLCGAIIFGILMFMSYR